ncbi:hypothetical protein FJT64_015136 [Amphibalanus amphitrite]|uniref:Uncharacterized protein n=1 Tax=Amphibalanus amphitrite TaxID=1232801 RepID=A0A6A4X563_AMPAM|nr:hypothetical protein FJT64_015136 [Amphibalanus amphitrite]
MDGTRRFCTAGGCERAQRLAALLAGAAALAGAALLLWGQCMLEPPPAERLPAELLQSPRPAAAEVARLMARLGRPPPTAAWPCALSAFRSLLVVAFLTAACALVVTALYLLICRVSGHGRPLRGPPVELLAVSEQLPTRARPQHLQPLLEEGVSDPPRADWSRNLRGGARYGSVGTTASAV